MLENQQWSVASPQTIEIDGVQRLRTELAATAEAVNRSDRHAPQRADGSAPRGSAT